MHRFTFRALTILASAAILSSCGPSNTKPPYNANGYDSHYGKPEAAQKQIKQQAKLKATAPKRYIVKKGDTLWGISKKFLVNPWFWPEIWDKNQRIKNPHLIYPGDTLYIYYGANGENKLTPRIRVERTGQGEPISALIPFLAWPRVMDKATIDQAPYIIDSANGHTIIGDQETIYVKRLKDQAPGGRYVTYHTEQELRDPENNKLLGYEVSYGGYAHVTQPGKIASARVIRSEREIRQGDHLFKPQDETRHLNVPIHSPKKKIRGSVAALYDAKVISGQYMIAAINRGSRHGIETGHALGIYKPGNIVEDGYEKQRYLDARNAAFKDENKPTPSRKNYEINVELPPERSGTMVVYKVLPNMSYGLIMDSNQEIKRGYKIGNP